MVQQPMVALQLKGRKGTNRKRSHPGFEERWRPKLGSKSRIKASSIHLLHQAKPRRNRNTEIKQEASQALRREEAAREWPTNSSQCFLCAWSWWQLCRCPWQRRRTSSMSALSHASTPVRKDAREMGRALASARSNATKTAPIKRLLVCPSLTLLWF